MVLQDQSDAASFWTLKTPKEQEAVCRTVLPLGFQSRKSSLTKIFWTFKATYLAAPHPEILELLERSKRRHHFIWGSDSTAM